jgi:hypothetical protein
LFSWLYARKNGGKFILRIEDTDLERSSQASVDAILEGMEWLGLEYDEGPFYQTQRFDRYKEVIQQLLDQGDAYYCYCSREELDALREQQMANKEKPRYNGKCRHGAENTGERVVRFKNPEQGEVVIDDLVKGDIDVAIVWGPIAGYFAKQAAIPLEVVAIPEYEDKNVKGKENWNISIGVRNKDKARAEELNKAIANRQADIDKILDQYGVPHSKVVVGDSLEKKAREQNRGEKVDKPI